MKTITLYEKKVKVGEQEVSFTSLQLFRNALESQQVKGIKEIRTAIAILDKCDKATEALALTDEEFTIVYNAVDVTPWVPAVLQFKEFFDELELVKG